jgi:hypothetical protein
VGLAGSHGRFSADGGELTGDQGIGAYLQWPLLLLEPARRKIIVVQAPAQSKRCSDPT